MSLVPELVETSSSTGLSLQVAQDCADYDILRVFSIANNIILGLLPSCHVGSSGVTPIPHP